MTSCPECREPLPPAGLSCPECGWSKRKAKGKRPRDRAEYLDPRTKDLYCRIHKVALDATGFCEVAQAWWVPKFRCPECAGELWDNGFCANCTPKTARFLGDYFEQRWDAEAGREYGHFVRVSGSTPAPNAGEVQQYLAELKALVNTVADRLDVNGAGVSRRLRGCRCDECMVHFAAVDAPLPVEIETADDTVPF
jgi:hypothetical protein